MTNAPPSQDPADQDSLTGMANLILRKFLQGVDDCLPARIINYNRDTNRALVAPMVALLTTNGEQVARASVASVPVLLYGGGGFMLNMPMQAGDLGWIKACDRDISMFLQAYSGGPPNTIRMHTFEDSWFIPDAMRNFAINGEDDGCAVLQSLDGALRLSVGGGRVKMTAGPASVTVTPGGTSVIGGLTIDGIPFIGHTHTGGNGTPDPTGGVIP